MKMIRSISIWGLGTLLGSFLFAVPVYSQNKVTLTDPEIASVAVVANQIDIDYAAIAMKKSSDKEVVNFAETMASDHKAIIASAVDLVTRLKVTPKDNAVSKKLNSDAEETKKMLMSKSGKDFDKAYIDNEVAYHKAVIETVVNVLIPQSQNAELKALLQSVVEPLKAHLKHAEMVQAENSKGNHGH